MKMQSALIILPANTELGEMDFLEALDKEISKVTAKQALEAEQKRLRSKLQDKRLSDDSKQDARAQLASLAHQLNQIQWKVEATVALFQKQTCDNCGSVHTMFLQHMQRQVTRARPIVRRWMRTPGMTHSVPQEVVMQESVTHCCSDCAEEMGFDFTTAQLKFHKSSEPFAIAADYVQEEEEIQE